MSIVAVQIEATRYSTSGHAPQRVDLHRNVFSILNGCAWLLSLTASAHVRRCTPGNHVNASFARVATTIHLRHLTEASGGDHNPYDTENAIADVTLFCPHVSQAHQ